MMIVANIPSAKKIIVHGPDLSRLVIYIHREIIGKNLYNVIFVMHTLGYC